MRLETLPPAEEGARLLGRDRAPADTHYQWVPSDSVIGLKEWEEPRACRWTTGPGRATCREESVAVVMRGSEARPRPWHYCAEHLYGRVIVGTVVYDLRLREGAPA